MAPPGFGSGSPLKCIGVRVNLSYASGTRVRQYGEYSLRIVRRRFSISAFRAAADFLSAITLFSHGRNSVVPSVGVRYPRSAMSEWGGLAALFAAQLTPAADRWYPRAEVRNSAAHSLRVSELMSVSLVVYRNSAVEQINHLADGITLTDFNPDGLAGGIPFTYVTTWCRPQNFMKLILGKLKIFF